MTEKELKRLNRTELLEMLLLQTKKVEELQQQLEQVKAELESKSIKIEKSGSIAEASLQLADIFTAAQEAADIYLENMKQRCYEQEQICAQREAESEKLLEDTRAKCRLLEVRMKEECEKALEKVKEQVNGTEENS